ncbi:MAG: hypothetical protein QOG64_2750 [Acidimicrobiaceae bacterium]|nr:hypothetical protein [Acidimicrobiaceae bacterium]
MASGPPISVSDMTATRSAGVPDAPWALAGECLVALVPRRRLPGSVFPPGIGRLPGPIVVIAIRYTESPVGPFLELAIAEPARVGLRPGWTVTTSVVSAPPARIGGRLGWGFPRELGTLTWSRDGEGSTLRWEDRDIVVRSPEPGGGHWPFLVPMRSLQRRADGPVIVPGHGRGRARFGRLAVEAPQDDPLASLAGDHFGITVTGMRTLLRPARRPAGLFSSLRAPLWAAEPAMAAPPTSGSGYSAASPGALSSVG